MTGKAEGLFFIHADERWPVMSCVHVGGDPDDPLFSIIALMPDGLFNAMPILCSRYDIERRKLN